RSTEIMTRLSQSPVEFCPPVPVSVRTGAGIEALRETIAAIATKIPARESEDLFRLPVDRVFSLAGVGTVITGTAWSGSVDVGQTVTILPGGLRSRIRSIEAHGQPLQRSIPGARIALGLAGVRREAISRGAVLVGGGDVWPVTTTLDAEITLDE